MKSSSLRRKIAAILAAATFSLTTTAAMAQTVWDDAGSPYSGTYEIDAVGEEVVIATGTDVTFSGTIDYDMNAGMENTPISTGIPTPYDGNLTVEGTINAGSTDDHANDQIIGLFVGSTGTPVVTLDGATINVGTAGHEITAAGDAAVGIATYQDLVLSSNANIISTEKNAAGGSNAEGIDAMGDGASIAIGATGGVLTINTTVGDNAIAIGLRGHGDTYTDGTDIVIGDTGSSNVVSLAINATATGLLTGDAYGIFMEAGSGTTGTLTAYLKNTTIVASSTSGDAYAIKTGELEDAIYLTGSNNRLEGAIDLGDGSDLLDINGGASFTDAIDLGAGSDTMLVEGNFTSAGSIIFGTGDDTLTFAGTTAVTGKLVIEADGANDKAVVTAGSSFTINTSVIDATTGVLDIQDGKLQANAGEIHFNLTGMTFGDDYKVVDVNGAGALQTTAGVGWGSTETDAYSSSNFLYATQYTIGTGSDAGDLMVTYGAGSSGVSDPSSVTEVEQALAAGGATNANAGAVLLTGTPASGSQYTNAFQTLLLAEDRTAEEIDQLVQQFTPSMSQAISASVASASSTVHTQIGMQMNTLFGGPSGTALGNNNGTTRGANGCGCCSGGCAISPCEISEGCGYADSPSGTSYYTGGPQSRWCQPKRNLWFQGFGYTMQQEGKTGFAGFDGAGGGFALGTLRQMRTVALGLAYGYTNNTVDTTGFNAAGTPNHSRIGTHSLIGFGSAKLGMHGILTGQIGYTWGCVDGWRVLPLAGNPTSNFSTRTGTFSLLTSIGIDFIRRQRFLLRPKFGFNYFNYDQKGYTESLGFVVDEYKHGYFEFDFLADIAYRLNPITTLTSTIGYKQVVNAEGARLGTAMEGLSYNIDGIKPVENIFVFDIGLKRRFLRNWTLSGTYNMRTGNDGYSLHGATGMLGVTF